MEIEKIFSLIDKAEKSSFNKIEIKTEDVTLNLERALYTETAEPLEMPVKEKPAAKRDHDFDDIILAPISGVFYVAKEPGAEPFIKEGTKVNKGDVVCIIEAMKMMNEITAPKSGVIESILKKDAEAIVAEDALFKYAKES